MITTVAGRVLATARSITERLELPGNVELVDHIVADTRVGIRAPVRLRPAQLSPIRAGIGSMLQ